MGFLQFLTKNLLYYYKLVLVFLPFLLYYLPENMIVFDFMTRMNSFFTPGISFSALFLIVLLTTVLSRKLYISSWDSF